MKAVLKDGTEIECDWFKISEGGALLKEDGKRGEPVGFVPMDELRTIAPDEYEPKDRNEESDENNASGTF